MQRARCKRLDSSQGALALTGCSFIEENKASKEAQRKAQLSQPEKRGQASQEMMQYWGTKHTTSSSMTARQLTDDQDTSSRPCQC